MTARRKTIAVCGLAALLLSCAPARADVVADWNAIALKTVLRSEPQPAQAAYAMATVHLAMFEAINFVEGGYPPRLLARPAGPLGKTGEATAAAAAHHVLGEMYPGGKAALDKALDRSLAAIPDEQERSNARLWGRELGGIIHAARSSAGGTPRSPKTAQVTAPLAALNAMVAAFIEARGLLPLDRARIHALASTAAADACAASRDTSTAVLAALQNDLIYRSHP
jgi:hypothetical protein